MSARPAGVLYPGHAPRALRPSGGGTVWVAPVVLLGFALAVVALFALMLTVVMDAAQQAPLARVVESTFSARTDGAAPYAASSEMRVKPQRPAGSVSTPRASD